MIPLLLLCGCGSPDPQSPSVDVSDVMESNPELYQELQGEVSRIINDTSIAYQQLDYEYAEDLLDRLDRYEAYFAADPDSKGEPPRYMPKLEPEVELAHIQEVIRRWEAQTGKDLRAEIDVLKSEVEARTGEELFHPEFQKNFSIAFDDFIRFEVEEIQERRNRSIHEQAEALFAPHRADHPQIVEHFQAMINTPQYAPKDSDPVPAE